MTCNCPPGVNPFCGCEPNLPEHMRPEPDLFEEGE